MTASRAASGSAVELAYLPACGTLDNAVYWGTGPIAGSVAWTNAACAVGNTGHATFDPGDPTPDTFFYFVIVGQSATEEGSYGLATRANAPKRSESAPATNRRISRGRVPRKSPVSDRAALIPKNRTGQRAPDPMAERSGIGDQHVTMSVASIV